MLKDRFSSGKGSAIIRQYNALAEDYAKEIKENPLQADSFYFLLDLVKEVKGSISGGAWLDAGCGPGCFSASTLNLNYTKLVGVDISDKMAAIAGKKDAYSDIHVSSLTSMPFLGPGSFSVYFSNNVFHFLHAMGNGCMDIALSEAFRVLKDSGLLAVNMSSTGTSELFISAYRKVVQDRIIRYGRFSASNPSGVKTDLVRSYPIGSMDLKELVTKVKKQGFRVVRALKRYEPISYPDRESYVMNMRTYAKFLYLAPFEHLPEAEQEAIFEEVAKEFIKEGEGKQFTNSHFMNYIVAIK